MKILVTGNNGYIGSVLVQELIKRDYEVIGYDINYYKECILDSVDELFTTIVKDIRDISIRELEGINSIIHLAAVSGGIGLLANHHASIMRDISRMTFNILTVLDICILNKAVLIFSRDEKCLESLRYR